MERGRCDAQGAATIVSARGSGESGAGQGRQGRTERHREHDQERSGSEMAPPGDPSARSGWADRATVEHECVASCTDGFSSRGSIIGHRPSRRAS